MNLSIDTNDNEYVQLHFVDEDEVAVYRIGYSDILGNVKYMIQFHNMSRIIIDSEDLGMGTYQIQEMIEKSKDEKDLRKRIMALII